MWREFLVLSVVSCVVLGGGFPYITPTVGLIWPQPREVQTNKTYFILDAVHFNFNSTGFTCDILEAALEEYRRIAFPMGYGKKSESQPRVFDRDISTLTTFVVNLKQKCEDYPHMGMDESYEITITGSSGGPSGSLESESIWGILRGLESFSQLVVPLGRMQYRVNETHIKDSPRFPHRGLMIDSSRHYLPLEKILETIHLLAMNKFNVLHWHIVDEQSFPYVSGVFPALSAKGSYTQDRVYSAEDIKFVVDYARFRGIRVVPEFDTPGHTLAWGQGQPDLLTPCYSGGKPDGTFGPVDPTHDANYDFLTKLFTEVTQRFPDHYIHLGGDEVSFNCWQSNPNITDFMKKNNITGDYSKLEEVYITKLLGIISDLPTKNGYVIWQEVFDNGVKIAPDTVVEVWKGGWEDEVAKVTKAGYKTILSTCWYLNYISYGDDWKNFYGCEPFSFNGTDTQKQLIQGGEACIWGEYVDKTNLISRTWPRGSAVGEKLWSPEAMTKDTNGAAPRLEEFRCKLLARGFNVESLGPSFCTGDNE